ncbi:hypothetical protein ACFSC3_18910 [Sphingomonas floccifaciens]|uniref:Inhibitor of vertebrate lysozyme (Ivy) n=1 Tax=Sphingomonas floccifaciens TaxID=1844115 RepID=A0ABW4NHK4_9SPHN
MKVGRKILVACCAGGMLVTTTPMARSTTTAVGPPSEQAIHDFFGERRQPIYFDDTLARQFAIGISGGVEDERILPGGDRFVATCRPHNCADKAAVVIAKDGRILGAGMIGFRCHHRGDGVPPCDENPSAIVYVKRATTAGARNQLRAWAIKRLADPTVEAGHLKTKHDAIVIEFN